MAEFVKKNVVGYKKVDGGQSDPECTHVIVTLNEYDELLSDVRQAQRSAQKAKEDAASQIAMAKQEAATEARRAAENADNRVREVEGLLAEEESRRAYQERLNANLLRISKERANADRKLKPKKTHTGYIVTYSAEREHRYRERKVTVSVMLWETVLQTPYSVDFTEEQVKVQTQELFEKDEQGRWLIQRIGINANYGGAYESLINDREWAGWPDYNVLLEQKYRANYKTGYWELVFTHTKALGIVPEDMRP